MPSSEATGPADSTAVHTAVVRIDDLLSRLDRLYQDIDNLHSLLVTGAPEASRAHSFGVLARVLDEVHEHTVNLQSLLGRVCERQDTQIARSDRAIADERDRGQQDVRGVGELNQPGVGSGNGSAVRVHLRVGVSVRGCAHMSAD